MVYPLNVGQNVEYTLDGGKNWLLGTFDPTGVAYTRTFQRFEVQHMVAVLKTSAQPSKSSTI